MLPAMPIVAGRVTKIDRQSRTVTIGPMTFTLRPGVSLDWIEIGIAASVIYEVVGDGVLQVVELLRLAF